MVNIADFSDCRNCACMAARKEAQRLTRDFDQRLRPLGLTVNQFSMLVTLILAGPTPVSRLAAQLGIERTTMTRNITLGERRGLVSGAPGKDGRERLISVTSAGLAIAEQALPAWRAAQERALADNTNGRRA
jgi:DNA-binding MarR family transcriptional regulator